MELRIKFDAYFIKSSTTNNGTRWEIRDIEEREKEKNDYIRKKKMDGAVVQIQSMLYVSTSTSLWMPEVLKYVNDNNSDTFTEADFLKKMEQIDDSLHPESLTESGLNDSVNTSRYKFYKLDYLLWKKWSQEGAEHPQIKEIDNLKTKIKNFQFRDNRSVEHVHSRNPDPETWVAENPKALIKIKNKFGNLALISINSNSSYNNQSTANKKDDFIKRTKNWGIESLKLISIYSKPEWTIEAMNHHQNEMIKILNDGIKYFNHA